MPKLRDPYPEDHAPLAALLGEHWREFTSPEDFARSLENRAPESRVLHRVLAGAGGEVLGYGRAIHHPWQSAGTFEGLVLVHPGAHGRGLGQLLADEVWTFARRHGATRLRAFLHDDPASLAFARRWGFTVTHHAFVSRLDVTTFDEAPFVSALERAHVSGLRFTTLAREGMTEQSKRALYALNRAAGLDVPDSGGTFPPYEHFDRQVFRASWFDPSGQILAVDGGRYVGLGALGVNAGSGVGENAFTGVDRAYRGRGLATAPKLLVVREARRRGVRLLETGNDSRNAPILRVNRRFGYVPLPGWFTVEAPL
ncbi:GNAT family N-acetyltransferase [Deinococcus planocerae]|uniref:GNAT family N-acetyltransferase n=1 Tax=Deinococcus planocerae TaxID=1737569 RepID=UPI000C7F0460|nr:GNAT family N-acetyltransferase [Deinococcus planocerae]